MKACAATQNRPQLSIGQGHHTPPALVGQARARTGNGIQSTDQALAVVLCRGWAVARCYRPGRKTRNLLALVVLWATAGGMREVRGCGVAHGVRVTDKIWDEWQA